MRCESEKYIKFLILTFFIALPIAIVEGLLITDYSMYYYLFLGVYWLIVLGVGIKWMLRKITKCE